MTRKKPGLALRVLLIAFFSFFGLSQAAATDACTARIDALRAALDGGCYKSKVCEGLSKKLDNAEHKLAKGKTRKAERRLVDFVSIVDDMANRKKGKHLISDAAYDAVVAAYYDEGLCNPVAEAPGATDGGTSGSDTGTVSDGGSDLIDIPIGMF